jgi:ribosomal protein S18 acetylase RimI-like enzyme
MINSNEIEKTSISIENNLVSLFKYTNHGKINNLIKKSNYSAVYCKDSAWPNFIFDLNISNNDCEEFLEEINSEINNGELPPFIITGPKSEKDFFEDFFYTIQIRKIMEWPAMAIDLNSFNHNKNENIDIRKVENEPDLEIWLGLVSNELFKKVNLNKYLFLNLLKKQEINLYLGYQNKIPVCTALLFLFDSIAGVYMISTSIDYRNLGYGRYITSYILNVAKEKKFKKAVLQATPEGYPLYKKIGFQEYGKFNIYWKIGKTLK